MHKPLEQSIFGYVMKKIPFHVPYLAGDEIKYLNQVLDSGNFAGNGPFTKKAQSIISKKTRAPATLLTHSCTGALELSAMLLDIGPNDEVIVPSYTFVSTASAFLRNGAKVIFADIDEHTLMLDKTDVLEKITPNTKAIIPVNYAGLSSDLSNFIDICEDNDIYLIEDNAQGFGSESFGKPLGTHGVLGALSFHETKNIHCGLGGALLINQQDLFDRAENIWERGTNRTKMIKGIVDKYTWVDNGSSFYPTELQASFLVSQLKSMNDNINYRKKLCDAYDSRLSEFENSGSLRRQERENTEVWNFHAMVVIFNSPNLADKVREGLLENYIHAYIGYVPLHSSPMGVSLGWKFGDLPITDKVAPCILRLPLHSDMSVDDVDRVCDVIKKYLKEDL